MGLDDKVEGPTPGSRLVADSGDKNVRILFREVTHLTKRIDAMEKEAELHRMTSMALRGLQAQHDHFQSLLQTSQSQHELLREEVQNLSKRVGMQSVGNGMPSDIENSLNSVLSDLKLLQQNQQENCMVNNETLRQELVEERNQMEEILENITDKKLEVIELLHTFQVSKQQAFQELATIMDKTLKDLPSGRPVMERSDEVPEAQEQVGRSVNSQLERNSRQARGSSSVPPGPILGGAHPVLVRAPISQGFCLHHSAVQHHPQQCLPQARMLSPRITTREFQRAPSVERMTSGVWVAEHHRAPWPSPAVRTRDHVRAPSAENRDRQRAVGRQVMVSGEAHELARSSSPPHSGFANAAKEMTSAQWAGSAVQPFVVRAGGGAQEHKYS